VIFVSVTGACIPYLFHMNMRKPGETVMDGMRHSAQSHSMGVWGIAGFFVAMLVVVSLFS